MFQLNLNLKLLEDSMTPCAALSMCPVSCLGLSGHQQEKYRKCLSVAKIQKLHPVGNVLRDICRVGICHATFSAWLLLHSKEKFDSKGMKGLMSLLKNKECHD